MKGLTKIVNALILSVSLTSCAPVTLAVYDDVRPKKPNKESELLASQETFSVYLYRILDSGFLNDTKEIKEEIYDNQYGVLKNKKTKKGSLYLGFYYGLKEQVLLSEYLFIRKEKGPGITFFISSIVDPLPILMHELFHDFWYNDLISSESKKDFSIEVRKLYDDMINSNSLEEKIDFLKRAGYSSPEEKDFKEFQNIIPRKEEYGDLDFFSNELHSVFAELTYAKKIIMPRQLREFYKPLISEEWLNKTKPK
ncbi:MAG: hypothetical protein KKA65_03280 [Nanoarchaeota archaeon]|nr:hypothetical protein [Nanoarchaeota archaeon]MBU4352017.1 hypothetical protein [Nanoarchaeota archaeon]MBU4456500.1 hypothetical protein [Nanoarchaeota archaeon]MCG2719324.1 hypothetical protein [Nanoarchaeota archaeon]